MKNQFTSQRTTDEDSANYRPSNLFHLRSAQCERAREKAISYQFQFSYQ
jgi:hypothetical protein